MKTPVTTSIIIVIFVSSIIIGLWFICSTIAFTFFSISDTEARNIALGVIQKEYEDKCGGNFVKYLTVQIDGYRAKYEFYSNNGVCDIYIDINEFGGYDTGIMAND